MGSIGSNGNNNSSQNINSLSTIQNISAALSFIDSNNLTREQVITGLLNGEIDVNPGYYTKKYEFINNCALCQVAVALQLMGYDAEAQGRDAEWRGIPDVFDIDYGNTNNYICSDIRATTKGIRGVITPRKARRDWGVEPDIMPRGSSAAAKAIVDKVKSWGDGSFAALNVKWKPYIGLDGKTHEGSAHAVILLNRNNRIYVYDGQSKEIKAVEQPGLVKYLKRTVSNRTNIVRLDNATLKQNIPDIDKIVKNKKSNMSVAEQLKRFGL